MNHGWSIPSRPPSVQQEREVSCEVSNQKPISTAVLRVAAYSFKELRLWIMLRKSEKKALSSLFLLCIGAPLALDRFYETGPADGLLGILGFVVSLVTVVGLAIWAVLVFSKMFRLLKDFSREGE